MRICTACLRISDRLTPFFSARVSSSLSRYGVSLTVTRVSLFPSGLFFGLPIGQLFGGGVNPVGIQDEVGFHTRGPLCDFRA